MMKQMRAANALVLSPL